MDLGYFLNKTWSSRLKIPVGNRLTNVQAKDKEMNVSAFVLV